MFITILLALLPFSECRGSIAYGLLIAKLDPIPTFIASVIGNIIPAPFILAFLKKLEKLVVGRFHGCRVVNAYLNYVSKVRRRVKPYIDNFGMVGLAVFVMVPSPFTGAWTASLAAYLLGFRKGRAFASILLGVIGAALILTASISMFI